MTTNEESPIRTSGNRMAKGLAVIFVVIAVGAGINLAFSDVWHASPPAISLKAQETNGEGAVPSTGVTQEFQLRFVESADFRTLGFNSIEGEEGANPEIVVNVGDRVVIELENAGKMPHAFGVVSDPDDPNSTLFDSAFKSASNPLKSGESGEVTFTPSKEGEYFYICTVPGHPALGMMGKFIVKSAEGGAAAEPAEPTGISHTFDLEFAESDDFRTLGFNAIKGEPDANPEIRVKAGDTVIINVANNGKMPHAFGVVSDPDELGSIVFDSKIQSADNPILRGKSGTVEFMADKPGHYFYICTVPGHSAQGMMGDFIVE
ncbi:MAG: plastocyanin/azurin family copper-binding protein [Nitrososphaerales archaeon]